MATGIKRTYSALRGVDFSNDPSIVILSRSPDALNVWKNYADTQGSCIETRPGLQYIADFGDKIYGMHIYNNKAIVHSGKNLLLWNNYPSEPEEVGDIVTLKSNMAEAKSSFVIYEEKLYILDGTNYLVYNGTTLKNVTEEAFIPTTTIGRSPSGGGEEYQDVNVLSDYRINSFIGDGTSTDYYLDAMNIDSVEEVKVNGSAVASTDYTVDTYYGKVAFNTAPSVPDQDGVDNVTIKFRKAISGYANRIQNCTKILNFDNRVFFIGNPTFKNALFHSELRNPAYISDLAYYQDGTDESAIKDIVVGNNILWAFKEATQENETIFYHTPTLDQYDGKIYPVEQGNVSEGCYACGINYSDDIVFLSKKGLEGISGDISSEKLLSHRSSLVDNELINSANYRMSQMAEWEGYLLILVNGQIFLADTRQKFQGINGYEYEWYLWNFGLTAPSYIKEYKGTLYLGDDNGKIYQINKVIFNDLGEAINSYWTTPMDNFGYDNMLKITSKRGGIAKIKTIPNGKINIAVKSNKRTERYITSKSANGFNYGNFDYSNFAYTTKNESYIVYKIKEKKIVELSLKFYSNEADKPFGLISATIEAFIGGYVKK